MNESLLHELWNHGDKICATFPILKIFVADFIWFSFLDEDEASFQFINSPVEKEVLLYDLSDVIGTIGGSLGVAVGHLSN